MYKKANPRADINPQARDKFWDQQEVGLCVSHNMFLTHCQFNGYHYNIIRRRSSPDIMYNECFILVT